MPRIAAAVGIAVEEGEVSKSKKKLYRSRASLIGGVCAGIADFFDLDDIVVRVLAVLIACTTLGVGGLIYLVMWIALPLAPSGYTPYEVKAEHVDSSNYGSVDVSQARGRTLGELSSVSDSEGMNTPVRVVMAVGLLLLFTGVAQTIAPFIKDTSWWQWWPLALIITGFAIIVVPIAREWTEFWHLGGAVLIIIGWTATPMSLGFISPHALVAAFCALWPILLLSIALFVGGVCHKVPPMAIAAVAFFCLFCLAALTTYAEPGHLSDLVLLLPDGTSRLMLHGPSMPNV